jgi:hypothetical protein
LAKAFVSVPAGITDGLSPNPVAYAHRQRSIALWAKTKQPQADLRLWNSRFKNQQSSLDNHQSVA